MFVRTSPVWPVAALLLPILTGAVLAQQSPTPIKPDWSAKVIKELNGGEVPLFHPAKKVKDGGQLAAAVYIDAPREEVWKVLTNPEACPEYIPTLKASQLLENTDEHQLISQKVKMGILPMTLSYNYKLRKLAVNEQLDFKMTSGDLSQFEGGWHLLDAAGLNGKTGTVAFYQIYLNPGNIAPGFMVRGCMQKDVPDMLSRVRDRVYAMRELEKKQLALRGKPVK